MKLYIAPYNGHQEGFTSIQDVVPTFNTYPWKEIQDSSVDEVFCSNYINKVADLTLFMQELYRICKNNATIKVVTPYYSNVKATADLNNIRPISEWTLQFFNDEFRENNNMKKAPFSFRILGVGFQWNSDYNTKSEEAKEFARVHFLNVIENVMTEMKVIK